MNQNSRSFQKNHFEDYQKFFSSHDLVLSVPQLFTRGYSAHKSHSQLHIKQKLPTKVYIGVTKTSGKKNILANLQYYSITGGDLISKKFEEIFGEDRKRSILEIVDHLRGEKKQNDFYRINFFAERQKNIGCCLKSSIMTLLGGFVHILGDKPNLLQNSKAAKIMNQQILAYAMYINGMSSGNKKPTGLSSYTILQNESLPIVQRGGFDIDEVEGTAFIKNANGNGKRFSIYDLVGVKTDNLPIDYGILFLGKQYHSSFSELKHNHTKDSMKHMDKFLNEDLGIEHRNQLNVRDLSTLFYCNIIKSLKIAIQHPGDKYQCSNLLQSIIDCGWYHALMEKEHQSMIDAYHSFNQVKKFDSEKTSLIPLSSMSVGASFLFACNKHESRDTLDLWLTHMQSHGYAEAKFLFLPRRDGLSNESLIIEQYLGEGLYSRYIEPGSVAFLASNGSSYLNSYREIVSKEKNGVILDNLYKKIYINGIKLTHKDLASQSMTVEVLNNLLERSNRSIHNTQLPPSSYSKNKNEMVGKIIIPFNNLIQKHFNKKLGLICSGSQSDFNVSLEEDLGLLHRINSVKMSHDEF